MYKRIEDLYKKKSPYNKIKIFINVNHCIWNGFYNEINM